MVEQCLADLANLLVGERPREIDATALGRGRMLRLCTVGSRTAPTPSGVGDRAPKRGGAGDNPGEDHQLGPPQARRSGVTADE
jgi:hypothetical protein